MRKSLSFHSSVRYFKYIVLVLLFYPLTVLGAQGHITVKGQSITIKEAIMLIEKSGDSLRNRTEEGEYGRLGAGYPPGGIESPFNESLPDVYPVWLLFSVQVVPVQTGRISGFEESQP